ncbi:hypothetical protein P3342_005361 [Pyrenophora teres f. teres]|nr:hypothetical protein P3342_005361 [Pyrenophora teres f. teres]
MDTTWAWATYTPFYPRTAHRFLEHRDMRQDVGEVQLQRSGTSASHTNRDRIYKDGNMPYTIFTVGTWMNRRKEYNWAEQRTMDSMFAHSSDGNNSQMGEAPVELLLECKVSCSSPQSQPRGHRCFVQRDRSNDNTKLAQKLKAYYNHWR